MPAVAHPEAVAVGVGFAIGLAIGFVGLAYAGKRRIGFAEWRHGLSDRRPDGVRDSQIEAMDQWAVMVTPRQTVQRAPWLLAAYLALAVAVVVTGVVAGSTLLIVLGGVEALVGVLAFIPLRSWRRRVD